MHNTGEIMQLCRLCLVKEQVNVPIFEGQGDVRQIFQKISSCLPVKINRSDKLPKNICDGCSEKLDLFYDFWNTSVNSEKQLLEWLGQTPLSAGAGTTIAAKNSTTKPTDPVQQIKVDVKQEPSDHTDNNESFQAETAMADDDETSFKEESAPPPKRARRAVTKRKPITVAPDSDDDDDDDYEPVEPLTKLEDESGNSDNDNDNDNEDDSFAAPSTSADDQPGPSGLGKDGVEAPNVKIKPEDAIKEEDLDNCYTCSICKRRYESEEYLNAHMELHFSDKGFHCNKCPKVFQTKKSLVYHYIFHKEKKHQCKICNRRFCRNTDLKRHKFLVHKIPYERVPKLETTTCETCNKSFDTVKKLRAHFLMHKPRKFKCDMCEKAFPAKSQLKIHKKVHSEVAGEFPCDLCSKTFPTQYRRLVHKKRVHYNNLRILCEICSASFTTKGAYVIHKRNHTNEYVAKCEECGIGFTTKSNYEKHRIMKHGLARHVCHICGKSFISAHSLRVHIGRHATEEEKEKAGFKCNECGRMYANEKLLKGHVYAAHKKPTKYALCNICGKEFTALSMKKHLQTHEKYQNEVLTCQYCGELFIYGKTLKRHLAENHPETVPFKCEQCGKAYADINTLKGHITKTHKIDGERKEDDPLACIVCTDKFASTDLLYQHQIRTHVVNIRVKTDYQKSKCYICLKIFSKIEYLTKHISNHHDENHKEHFCDICQSMFSSLETLKIHYQEHTREKQFCCFYCPKSFLKSEHLLLHERTHTGEKPFMCSYCGKEFNQASSLKIHVRGHTGERPYVCEFCNKGFTSGGSLNVHLKSCAKKNAK